MCRGERQRAVQLNYMIKVLPSPITRRVDRFPSEMTERYDSKCAVWRQYP